MKKRLNMSKRCTLLYFLLIKIYNKGGDMMDPIAFTLFGFEVRYYSLFILLAVAIAYFMIVREAKRFSISTDFIFNMFFWTLIFGIIGARLYYVVFNWEYFGSHIGEIWQVWQGGLAIHGGILFGLITISLYSKKHELRTIKLLDMIVVPLLLAQALGRWGNFFNSEAYGVATTVNHLRNMHIPEFIIRGMTINGITYTPTFLYESIGCFLGFIALMIVRRMKYVKVGQLSGLYLMWYGILRFFIEASRTDSLIFFGFKMAQIVSIIMFIIGVVLFVMGLKKSKYEDLYDEAKVK